MESFCSFDSFRTATMRKEFEFKAGCLFWVLDLERRWHLKTSAQWVRLVRLMAVNGYWNTAASSTSCCGIYTFFFASLLFVLRIFASSCTIFLRAQDHITAFGHKTAPPAQINQRDRFLGPQISSARTFYSSELYFFPHRITTLYAKNRPILVTFFIKAKVVRPIA